MEAYFGIRLHALKLFWQAPTRSGGSLYLSADVGLRNRNRRGRRDLPDVGPSTRTYALKKRGT